MTKNHKWNKILKAWDYDTFIKTVDEGLGWNYALLIPMKRWPNLFKIRIKFNFAFIYSIYWFNNSTKFLRFSRTFPRSRQYKPINESLRTVSVSVTHFEPSLSPQTFQKRINRSPLIGFSSLLIQFKPRD